MANSSLTRLTEYLAHAAPGCFAAAATLPAISIIGLGGTVTMGALVGVGATTWFSARGRKKLECPKALKKAINSAAEAERNIRRKFPNESLKAIEAARSALLDNIAGCAFDPKTLAAFTVDAERGGFPHAAAEQVVNTLAIAKPDIFSEDKGRSLTRDYAFALIERVFEAALEDTDYFEQFEKELTLRQAEALGQAIDMLEHLGLDINDMMLSLGDLHRKVETNSSKLDAISEDVAALAKSVDPNGLSEDKLYELARTVRLDIDDRDEAERELTYLVGVARDFLESDPGGSNLDQFVKDVRARARAKRHFDDGADEINKGLVALAERKAKLEQSQLALLEDGIKLDLLARRPASVARKEIQRLALVAPFSTRFNALLSLSSNYRDRGDNKGLRLDIEVSAALTRELCGWATHSDEKGTAKNNLGIALRILGERGDDGALEEAVKCYRNALLEWTRDRVPLYWAAAQNNLGIALQTLGKRGDDGTLEEAVKCYRDALLERTRDRVPLDWAMTQNNLGIALETLGERGDDGALEEAVKCYRNALLEWTRDRVPLYWAAAQNNLGNILHTIGERGDDEPLKEAIKCYRDALLERRRDRVPLDWAATQNNLGIALQTLGERGDDGALEEAVRCYRDALLEGTRDRVPLDWAMTQNNLGIALQTLGERGDDGALEEAVKCYRDALLERTRDRVPLNWAMTQNNLGIALQTLGERGDDEALEEAVKCHRDALLEWRRDRVPLDWAMTQNDLGNALRILGERGDDGALEEAVKCYRNALLERARDRVPLDWAMTQNNLGIALALRGKHLQKLEDILKAKEHLTLALREFEHRLPAKVDGTKSHLKEVQALIKKLESQD